LEVRKRRDAAPLPTSRHDGEIANLAEAFSSRLESLRPQLEACAIEGQITRARIDKGNVLLVGLKNFDLAAKLAGGVDAVMCAESANILADQVIDCDVYANGLLRVRPKAALRAGMTAETAILERDSCVLRWLHARASVHLHAGSAAYGRLSAEHFIHLEPGCVFEHMHAPQIHTITQDDPDSFGETDCTCVLPQFKCHICKIESSHDPELGDWDDIFASHRRRIRQASDFLLPAHQTLNANVISTGVVRFSFNSRFVGNTKSYKNTFVEEGACIHGSLVCGDTLYLGEHSSVTGPIMAEEDVVIASGARVGRPDALTTIAARNIKIAAGCQLHGTVWARVRGTIEN
jgi:cytoskeletal protein CcmA (bactofilin family)